VVVWLVNTHDTVADAQEFLRQGDVTLPCLLDTGADWYRSYARRSVDGAYAPYPLQVLIDQEGTIRHIAGQYDPLAMNDRINALLAD
jgi:peroxiredoxin